LTLTQDQVRRVATLANLALTPDEVEHMTTDLSGILTHIDELNELDTTGVEPMAQVLYDSSSGLREDVERTPLSNEDALANAPSAGSGYYKVPKVIDRT